MRSSLTVAVALAAASCAHSGPGTSPTLAGSVNGLHLDREALTGVQTMIKRTSDGTWVGDYGYAGWLEARRSGNLLQTTWGDVEVTFDPRYVAVHERDADLVFQRADGGPVPEGILVPLWLATRRWTFKADGPSGRCVELEGIGPVLVLTLPRRAVPYQVTVEEDCQLRFVEPVVRGGPSEVDPGP